MHDYLTSMILITNEFYLSIVEGPTGYLLKNITLMVGIILLKGHITVKIKHVTPIAGLHKVYPLVYKVLNY